MPDEPLHLQNMESGCLLATTAVGSGVLAGGVLVAGVTADGLVAARAERAPAVLRGGAVPREDHAADVRPAFGVVERGVELVDGLRAEGVALGGPVEGDPDGRHVGPPVVGQVAEVEPVDRFPCVGVERLGDGHTGVSPGRGKNARTAAIRAGSATRDRAVSGMSGG
jgi:hypothetical protein